MTTGQRIAQKRKELTLSQESLGDKLGVSRQAIYKWEADATLPEVEKLVALSKLFGVSVGWLLGVEETSSDAPDDGVELTDAQLKMVEEIAARYISSQPTPAKKRSNLFKPSVAAAMICLAIGLFSLVARLDRLSSQYVNLQNSVGIISSNVDSQIAGISDRVESILKAQNDLTAEYSAELISLDCGQNTATFSLRAVPKTYVDGMTALFLSDNGNCVEEFPAGISSGQTFTAEAAVPLSDSITLSVVFILPDGTRQTQMLDTYSGMLSATYPTVEVNCSTLYDTIIDGGKLTLSDCYVTVWNYAAGRGGSEVAEIKVGLFLNKELVAWAEPSPQPENYHGYEECDFFLLPDMELNNLKGGDVISAAAVVTDSYGRQFVCEGIPNIVSDEDGFSDKSYADAYYLDPDPDNWTF